MVNAKPMISLILAMKIVNSSFLMRYANQMSILNLLQNVFKKQIL